MDREKTIKAFEDAVMEGKSQGYNLIWFSFEVAEIILTLMKEQEAEIRQLRLALDIAKGTCKGIVAEGR